MAETKPTAATAAKSSSSVQPKKKGNSISWVAPLVCIIAGYLIWRFIIGNDSNFSKPDPNGGFWPHQEGPKTGLARMYLGGIIVPILIGALLTVITFVLERFLTISKATGSGNIAEFIRKVQYHLANKNVDAAIAECDKQKGSVGNVMKAGLRKYKEMISTELDTEQKVLAIQKEVEEATALELPMLQTETELNRPSRSPADVSLRVKAPTLLAGAQHRYRHNVRLVRQARSLIWKCR